MIETGKIRDNYFKVLMEEPFQREHVSVDLNNEKGLGHGKCGGRRGTFRETLKVNLYLGAFKEQEEGQSDCRAES